jgi:hypothetical protein
MAQLECRLFKKFLKKHCITKGIESMLSTELEDEINEIPKDDEISLCSKPKRNSVLSAETESNSSQRKRDKKLLLKLKNNVYF